MRSYNFFLLLLLSNFSVKSQTIIKADLKTFTNITLNKSPIVKQNLLNIKNAEGGVYFQKGVFDYKLVSHLTYAKSRLNLFDADTRNKFIAGKLKTNNSTASIAVKKKFRSGLRSKLNFEYSLTNSNFPINQFNQNIGSYTNNHSLMTTFSITQPIIRDRGTTVTTALEESAKLNLKSVENTQELASSNEVYQMVLAYWEYVASYETLKIYQQNEQRVKKVLDITKELVKADKKPASDLIQVNADLANQKRQTVSAKQNYYNTRMNLGRVIGFSEKESESISNPVNLFPRKINIGVLSQKNEYVTTLSKIAIKNRKDITANEMVEEALDLQKQLAENRKKPKLELTGFVKYGGMNTGNGLNEVFSTLTNKEGQSLGVGLNLTFSFPFSNNSAKGEYIQNITKLENQKVRNDNLKRNIAISVSIAYNNLINSVFKLSQAEESFNSYKEVYENERVKFQNGLTTLLNLTLFQERLTVSQIQYITAQQQFANAIVALRYETGTIIKDNEVNENKFYTVPISNENIKNN